MLDQEVQSLRTAKSTLEGESLVKDKANANLLAEIEALKERIKELEELIKRLEDELRSLRDAKEEDSKLNQELIEKNKKLTTELSDLNGILNSLKGILQINFSLFVDIVSSAAKASSQEPLDQEDQIFIQYINFTLKDDIQIAQLLPVGTREVDVSSACVDGIILWFV